MKKLMAITLVLAMVLAFGVTSSAATLGSQWTTVTATYGDANIPAMDYDDFTATADNTVKATANSDQADWGGAAAKVKVGAISDKLTVKVKLDYIGTWGNGDVATVIIAPEAADIVGNKTLGGQVAYTAKNGTEKGLTVSIGQGNAAGKFYFAIWTADTTGILYDGSENYTKFYDCPADGVYTIVYDNANKMVKINDNIEVSLAQLDEAGEKTWENTIAVDKAALAVGVVCGGTASGNIEILSINGTAANLFTAAADTTSSTPAGDSTSSTTTSGSTSSNPNTNDTLFVAVVAMMLSAAALTVVAVKAKKVK